MNGYVASRIVLALITAGPLTGILWNARRIVRSPDRRGLPVPILKQFWEIVRRPLTRWAVVWILIVLAMLTFSVYEMQQVIQQAARVTGNPEYQQWPYLPFLEWVARGQRQLFMDLSIPVWALAISCYALPWFEDRWQYFSATFSLLLPAGSLPVFAYVALESLGVPDSATSPRIGGQRFALLFFLSAAIAALFASLAIRRARSDPERFLGIEQ